MNEGEQATADDIHLSPARASELIAEGAQLIDVRTEHEWEAGRIAGAKRIELAELSERAGELERDRAVVFYCRGGNRSAMATAGLPRGRLRRPQHRGWALGLGRGRAAARARGRLRGRVGGGGGRAGSPPQGLAEPNTRIPVRFCTILFEAAADAAATRKRPERKRGSARDGTGLDAPETDRAGPGDRQGAARQGPARLAGEPRVLRERARARDPDHRARVRRLRHRGREVPRRADPRGPVHRLPPQAGRLRPAPARRADDPGEAPLRRRQPGADGGLRRRRRALRAARQGPHHDPPERPDPPRSPARHREADPRDLRGRPLLAGGLRQHGPQRDRRSLGRGGGRRGLRPDPVRRRLRPLLRPPPDDAADAAQDQDRLHRLRRRPGDHRHPRHRLHLAHPRRRPRLRGPGRRRHLDHAARRPDPDRVRQPPTTAPT